MISTNLLIIGVILCQLLLFGLTLMLVRRQISSLIKNVLSFFEPESEGKQSNFANTLDLIASRFGSAIVASLKGFLMAENSAAVRQDKAAARSELAGKNPLFGIAAKYAPGIIRKNPELAEALIGMFAGKSEGKSNENNGHEPTRTTGDPFKI